MQQILLNMANHLLIEYCLTLSIDCSDTRCIKDGRGFSYSLLRNTNGHSVARITFHKNQVPTYGW